jgi:hypothetical protein
MSAVRATRLIVASAILASLICSVAVLTGCQRTSQSALDRLHPCKIDEGPTEAFCGTYNVFENRSTNTGRQIALKIVVAPALKRDPRPDPLFILEGGPGAGAATLAAYVLPMFHRFEMDRDIVLIDQRGTGDSNPLNCEPEDREEEDFSKIDDYPVQRLRACLAGLKADAHFYTTAIAMDDVDEVRQYLGYGPINLWWVLRHACGARVFERARGLSTKCHSRRRCASGHATAAVHPAGRTEVARPDDRRLCQGRRL